MERNNTERVDDGQSPSGASVPQLKKTKSRKIISTIKKFWYVIAIIVVIIIGSVVAVVWRSNVANQDGAWARATEFYQKADYDNAAKEFSGLPVPTDATRLKIYAQTMHAKRDFEKALPAYEKLYTLTKDLNYKVMMGNIYNDPDPTNSQKDYNKAAGAYKEVIAANPGYTEAYVNLAILYKLQGNTSEAIATANAAVASNPNSVTLLELKVSMLMEDKTTDDYKTAVADLTAVNPQDPLLDSLK